MPKTVYNLFVNWVSLVVKNVFKVVDTSQTYMDWLVYQWNSPLYTLLYLHLPTLLIHSLETAITSVINQVIPIIHRAYNNQLERYFIKTSNRGSLI